MIEVPVYKILTNKYDSSSDRFVKKKHWGVADRQEGGGAAARRH